MSKKLGSLLVELVVVFLGVLGAYLVESRIQNSQDRQKEKETLTNSLHGVMEAVDRTGMFIYGDSLKDVRYALAARFRYWSETDAAPDDSLKWLLSYMLQPLPKFSPLRLSIFSLTDLNSLQKFELRSEIGYYLAESRKIDDEINAEEEINREMISRLIDFSQFNFWGSASRFSSHNNLFDAKIPKINPELSKKSLSLKKNIPTELKNRCLGYQDFLDSYADRAKYLERKGFEIINLLATKNKTDDEWVLRED